MSDQKIMILEKIEDIVDDAGNLLGKLITDKAGNQVKVKKGQGGKLAGRWDELQIGNAYSFTMGLFQGKYPFVEDFKQIKDTFIKQAQKQVQDEQTDVKNRSVTLSYSKDLAAAGVIAPITILEWADRFYQYVTTGIIGGKVEKKQGAPKIEPDKKAPVSKEISTDESKQKGDDRNLDKMREYVVTLGWTKAHKGKFNEYIQRKFHKESLDQLNDEELDELESSLKEMAELR